MSAHTKLKNLYYNDQEQHQPAKNSYHMSAWLACTAVKPKLVNALMKLGVPMLVPPASLSGGTIPMLIYGSYSLWEHTTSKGEQVCQTPCHSQKNPSTQNPSLHQPQPPLRHDSIP